jgi:CubicO group peptidase (beta-lactamase class C family)
MKRLITLLVLAGLLAIAFPAWQFLSGAAAVAVGHAAKQACSAVYGSGFSRDFATDEYLYPGLAPMGPLVNWLDVNFDDQAHSVSAELLGFSARAVFRGEAGCTLGARTSRHSYKAPRQTAMQTRSEPHGDLSSVLEEAFSEPAGGGRNTLAVLIRHRGELIAEQYRAPASAATPLQGWSMNKSLMATWVGMQVERGALSLEQKVAPLVAEQEPKLASRLDPSLDLGHLLHMESGLDFREFYFPGDEVTRMLYRSDAMWQVAPAQGHAYPPGEDFRYSSGDTNLAAYVWQRSLGGEAYFRWIDRYFSMPLGIESLVAEPDASGVQVGSSYTYMTARDWSQVGQLWLDAWHGRSVLLSRDWQRAAVAPRPAAQGKSYGRGFWLNSGVRAFQGLPSTLFYAGGHSGQYVVVMPELELVVVRLGLTLDDTDNGLQDLLRGVYQYFLSSQAER